MNYTGLLPRNKTGDCSQCKRKDTDVVKVKRDLFCLQCHRNNKTKAQLEKQKEKNKIRSLIHTPKNLVALSNKGLQDNLLDLWFRNRMINLQPICENCGATNERLKEEQYRKQWKSCQGHLLPKRHFDSIKTHPLNGMVLGTGYSGLCNCHDEYDSSWEAASKMNIWNEVVKRFAILYPLTLPNEHQFIPEQLLKTVTNKN